MKHPARLKPAAVVFAIIAFSLVAQAQTFSKLYDFLAVTQDRFVADSQGNFYGTFHVNVGGQHGIVFKISPPAVAGGAWTYKTILTLPTGYFLDGGLAIDKAGVLYGEENNYSTICPCGSVFSLTPQGGGAWKQATVYSFTGPFSGSGTDGDEPYGGLTIDATGNLYGVTQHGGTSGNGVAFKLAPLALGSYRESILYDFEGAAGDGYSLQAPMVLDKVGAIYGVGALGGNFGDGAIFRLSPPRSGNGAWSNTVLYSINCSIICNSKGSLVLDGGGTLYGTAGFDGGNGGGVFSLTPPSGGGTSWSFATLYSFVSVSNGQTPLAGVIRDARSGALYGTAVTGGVENQGVVFKLMPPTLAGGAWTETVLHSFNSSTDGSYLFARSLAPLVLNQHGVLFGTTTSGGANRDGTFWSVVP